MPIFGSMVADFRNFRRRFLEPRIAAALADTRIVTIVGARQVGKSTLARHLAKNGSLYLTFENLATLAAASANFLTIPTLSQSLAGRMELFTLLPLAQNEMNGSGRNFVDELFSPAPNFQTRNETLASWVRSPTSLERSDCCVSAPPGALRLSRIRWAQNRSRTRTPRRCAHRC
uniref:AAA domain-containing protein n=1 Tax=mine drainage metagenome TaxID=410659 RepID=E6PD74_9ZZZZ